MTLPRKFSMWKCPECNREGQMMLEDCSSKYLEKAATGPGR